MERYRITAEIIRAEDGAARTAYGICCGALRISDITDDRAALARLALQCNREALEPAQLPEVVSDFLAQLR